MYTEDCGFGLLGLGFRVLGLFRIEDLTAAIQVCFLEYGHGVKVLFKKLWPL